MIHKKNHKIKAHLKSEATTALVMCYYRWAKRGVKLLLKFSFLLSLFTITSCRRFVDVQIPKTLLYAPNTFNSNSTATAALTSIYSQMQNNLLGYNIALLTGLSGDELKNYSTFQSLTEMYANNLQTNNGSIQSLWSNLYSYIYQSNAVIEGLANSTGADAITKQQLTGEAKFIRAFAHFYLVNLFGDIPVVTATNFNINKSAERSGKIDVYQHIIADLLDAQDLLNENYVASDNVTTTVDRVRPTKWAVAALQARTYLYTGEWTNAEAKADLIINNKTLYDTVNLKNAFLKNSKEAIWQLQPVAAGYNTPEGKSFILTAKPSTGQTTTNCTTISQQLLSAFETGDLRRTNWIKDTTISSVVYSYPYKYKIQNGSTLSEYSMVFRLSEVYLIRAEARARQANTTGALADLNIIRKRAGLPNATATTQEALLDKIGQERRVEFLTEWGDRWFNMKRMNTIDATMNAVAPAKGAFWNTNKQLYPIPQNERNNDPNLSQNDGY